MKRHVLLVIIGFCLLFCSLSTAFTQTNLVLNPSLEDTLECPHGCCSINLTSHWNSPAYPEIGSTELFHGCSNFWNAINIQEPRTGDAMAGFAIWAGVWREYGEVELRESLRAGSNYCVSFYVSLANWSACAVNTFHAYFSQDFLYHSDCSRIIVNPQVVGSNGIITDTINWVHVEGSFVANGGERYMTIGNYYSTDSTIILNLYPENPYGPAYYFFDDFSVYECNATAQLADAGPEVNLCLGDSVRIGSSNFSDYLYSWKGTDGGHYSTGNPWVKPMRTTTYTLKQKDFKFEESYSNVTVYVKECENTLTVPNVFTPNNDGFNDKLEIINKKGFQYTIEIFDRWGRKVFSGNQDVFWDGRSSNLSEISENQILSSGVYFYSLKAFTREGNMLNYSGAVQLLK